MKAIILAAGIGSRLEQITKFKPKCLIEIGNQNILQRQIKEYLNQGINEIIIIGGYKIDMIIEFCKNQYLDNIKIIKNDDYLHTNNMYSLYLARNELYGENFLLSNGDVVFDRKIIVHATQNEGSSIAFYDSGDFNEEELKLEIRDKSAYAILPKGPISPNCSGSTIGIFTFNKQSSKYLISDIERVIEEEGLKNEWFEMSLNTIFKNVSFSPVDVKGLPWVEIDTLDDVMLAREQFK